jgi:transcriptional regulator with XRE-family HTH domain
VEDIKKLLGEQVRKLRKEKGISQEELGAKAELHYTYIGAIERGERNCSIDSLQKIAKGLGIEIPELFVYRAEINAAQLKKRIINEMERCSPEAIQALSYLVKLLEKK